MHPADVLYCSVPVAPMRAEPSHRSEEVSQALWGESMQVLGQEASWFRVMLNLDGYLGWVSERQVVAPPERVSVDSPQVSSDWALLQTQDESLTYLLSMGSVLRPFLGGQGASLVQGTATLLPREPQSASVVLERGRSWLGTPYLWGGRSRVGVECSGLVQGLLGSVGISVDGDARVDLAGG
ncbi:MAG: C40 family peptidase, partial [Bacteroidota bacterium]